jgi:hypothetical protein
MSPLAALRHSGFNIDVLIAEEGSVDVLDAALKRSRQTGDRMRELAIMERRLALSPHPTLRRQQTEALFWLGRPEAAAAAFATLSPGDLPADAIAATAILLAAGSGDWDRAAALVLERTPTHPEHSARLIQAQLRAGLAHKALETARSAREAHPMDTGLADMELRAMLQAEGPEAALAALSHPSRNSMLPPGSEVRLGIAAHILLALGRSEELCDSLFPKLVDTPWLWSLYAPASEAAWQSDRAAEFAAHLDLIALRYPDNTDLMATRCAMAADLGNFERAERLLPALRDRSEWDYLAARLTMACQLPGTDHVFTAYQAAIDAGMPPIGLATTVANYAYFYQAAKIGLDRALALITPFARQMGGDAGFTRLHLRLLIGLGKDDQARKLYAAIPRGLADEASLAPFAMYFAMRDNDDATARRGWGRHLGRTAPIALNARSSYPQRILLRSAPADPTEVLLFLTVFNGIEFLDWFLRYYRDLGVSRFYMIDNGSTDGTYERLLAEPDVSLFRNTESFRRSGCGVFWTNDLMRRYGVGHWCLHVDMDEAFVFPGMDQGRSLRDFLAFLEHEGSESVPALMIDIYPADLSVAATSGKDPFMESRYIDSDYTFMPCEIPPYSFVQGGLRARLTGRSLMMTKAPLIRMAADVAFLANNHQHSHVPMSQVGAALLHYKFIGDIRGRLAEAIARQEHFMGARFYRALAEPLGGEPAADAGVAAPATRLISETSVLYQGPQTLLNLGLMRSTAAWDHWKR